VPFVAEAGESDECRRAPDGCDSGDEDGFDVNGSNGCARPITSGPSAQRSRVVKEQSRKVPNGQPIIHGSWHGLHASSKNHRSKIETWSSSLRQT